MPELLCRISSAAMVSLADARFGKRDILGNARVEMMTDHQHVEMLVDGVDRERPRRIGRRRQDVRLAANLMMSGACPPPAPSV